MLAATARVKGWSTWLVAGALIAACGGGGQSSTGAGAGGVGAGAGQGGSGAAGGGGAGVGGGGSDLCDAFGRFGVPTSTFTLPTETSTYYPDVQASFPEVDWQNLDRLYIPAGEYPSLNLGNLPERDPSKPLVITNLGGQVKIGPNDNGNFIWSMSGGSGWILTGRYDPESQTGDEQFPGHRCGAYAESRGRYGFLSDDAFDLDAPYLHMGIAVSDASDFEIEHIEVTRSGFAGIRLLNKTPEVARPMANVKLHDTYVHDVDGEGIYLGWTGAPPSNLMPGLEVYDNRFIRTGNEALQVQNLGEGSHVHHNVMAYAAMHWRNNGLGAYQDSNSQIQIREGAIVVEENVFIGSAATLWSSFRGAEAGDGPASITFRNNYVATNRVGLGAYFGGAADGTSSYLFEGNQLREVDFSYDLIDPSATDSKTILRFAAEVTAPITLSNNRWEGDDQLVAGLGGPNGTTGSITATGNENASVPPVVFVDAFAEAPLALEFWCAVVTRHPSQPPRVYEVGELVVATDGKLYRATAQSQGQPPPDHPESWEVLPDPVDDFRVDPSSPYAGWGVR
ncbi:MAG: right-handed parallel beta-helix repeat-containing protein [Polyangiaceae bacterium]